jgi:hypothetical protein
MLLTYSTKAEAVWDRSRSLKRACGCPLVAIRINLQIPSFPDSAHSHIELTGRERVEWTAQVHNAPGKGLALTLVDRASKGDSDRELTSEKRMLLRRSGPCPVPNSEIDSRQRHFFPPNQHFQESFVLTQGAITPRCPLATPTERKFRRITMGAPILTTSRCGGSVGSS